MPRLRPILAAATVAALATVLASQPSRRHHRPLPATGSRPSPRPLSTTAYQKRSCSVSRTWSRGGTTTPARPARPVGTGR